MNQRLTGIPIPIDTLFTVRLPQGATPRHVTAGYDAPDTGPDKSFLLILQLDWTADAPRIVTAHLEAFPGRVVWIPVPRDHVRLATGPGLGEYDLLDEGGDALLSYATFQPWEATA